MPLDVLKISHLRNITQANLKFSPGINLIAGPNASGKTSLLEAIVLLCRGRSFRTARISQLVQHQSKQMLIVGMIYEGKKFHSLGLSREHNKTLMKLNGRPLTRSTELIELQALHVITPESHEILDQGPKMRRQYLDWGVFHVKPAYLQCWQRYHRILRQRNHALRSGEVKQAIQAWDKPLVTEAESLHAYRVAYLEKLGPALHKFGQQLLDLDVEFSYQPGWSKKYLNFAAQLVNDLEHDRSRGYTQSGPHRADISVKTSGTPVTQIFSRGQQKLLISAMYLAQVSNSPSPGLLLIDDLPAELDPIRRERLMAAAASTRAQIFVTATEPNLIRLENWTEKKVFHVEHGDFHEVI